MIRVLNCRNKNYKKKLVNFLEIRRLSKSIDTSVVPKILKDIKKNKLKAVIKYEKKFTKNTKKRDKPINKKTRSKNKRSYRFFIF